MSATHYFVLFRRYTPTVRPLGTSTRWDHLSTIRLDIPPASHRRFQSVISQVTSVILPATRTRTSPFFSAGPLGNHMTLFLCPKSIHPPISPIQPIQLYLTTVTWTGRTCVIIRSWFLGGNKGSSLTEQASDRGADGIPGGRGTHRI